jgi:hypothetical protein
MSSDEGHAADGGGQSVPKPSRRERRGDLASSRDRGSRRWVRCDPQGVGRNHSDRHGRGGRCPAFLATANTRHHEALVAIVAQIRGTGDLRKDLSDEDAARIIYYRFRFEQFRLAADGFGWGEQRARDWLCERVESAVLEA